MYSWRNGYSSKVHKEINWFVELNKNYDELREFIECSQQPKEPALHIELRRGKDHFFVVNDLFIAPVRIYFNNDWMSFFEFLKENSFIKNNKVKLLDYEKLQKVFPKERNNEEHQKHVTFWRNYHPDANQRVEDLKVYRRELFIEYYGVDASYQEPYANEVA